MENSDLIVSCYKCGSSILYTEASADLDGPAFRAYYCQQCYQDSKNDPGHRWLTPEHRAAHPADGIVRHGCDCGLCTAS